MLMKILILSDVHANLTALDAVLKAEQSFDRVLFLGDAVDYGPDPAACLDRLADLEPVWVRGNHDNAVATGADCGCAPAFRRLSRVSREFTRSVLRPEHLDLLRTLPVERAVSVGGQDFYLTHASPADHLFEYVSPTTEPQRLARAMEAAPDRCGSSSSDTPTVPTSGLSGTKQPSTPAAWGNLGTTTPAPPTLSGKTVISASRE